MLKLHKQHDTACCVVLRNLRQFREKPDAQILNTNIGLLEIQFALAMEYGFPNWAEMKAHVIATREKASVSESHAEFQNSSEEESTFMSLAELTNKKKDELIEMTRGYILEKTAGMEKQELAFMVLKAQIEKDNDIFGEGVLWIPALSGYGLLNPPSKNHQSGINNIRVSARIILRYNLRRGDVVSGRVVWRPKWHYYALYKVEAINYEPPDDSNHNRKTGIDIHAGYIKTLNPGKGPGKGEKNGPCCSFCGNRGPDAKTIIAGPGVFICDSCVHLCHSILQEEGRNLSKS